MKIKTIRERLDNAEDFDKEANDAMAEGWQLVKRAVLPAIALTAGTYANRMLYAELVLPDPPAEPAPFDPFEALHQVREFCGSIPPQECQAGNCPLRAWCNESTGGLDPADWDLPEVLDA